MNTETSNDIFSAATDTSIPDNESSQDSSIVNGDRLTIHPTSGKNGWNYWYNDNENAGRDKNNLSQEKPQ